ncbi:MAG: DUF4298 domain-containing protein [Oscillospiraceae bacterium]|nr:DUF4298 domain-containing protein [Oscillospiraceae bacterium]
MTDRTEQLRRIAYYESLLRELAQALSEADAALPASLRDKAEALGRYYGSEAWKRDFADDEAGLLPKTLRRGVLSEDGIYNVLEEYRGRLEDSGRGLLKNTAECEGDTMNNKETGKEQSCGFYGAEAVPEEIRELYRDLKHVWCPETCAPRLRPQWSEDNLTWGQCSITSFLVQDLYGGKVYGVPLPEGGFHCFNVVGDCVFDLTSEQFGGEELDYADRPEQLRETHFADADKFARYELLKEKLTAYQASKA